MVEMDSSYVLFKPIIKLSRCPVNDKSGGQIGHKLGGTAHERPIGISQ